MSVLNVHPVIASSAGSAVCLRSLLKRDVRRDGKRQRGGGETNKSRLENKNRLAKTKYREK